MNARSRRFPHIPERIAGLGELAFNLWWSWHPAARMLFKNIDREAWKESVHNPVKMLRELPTGFFERVAGDQEYVRNYDEVLSKFREEMASKDGWFSRTVTDPDHFPVAYFSAEYGLHHSLPFYAGGLGFLAGDYLKECSDLGIPVIAIGFMYPEGYIRQKITSDGWQENVDDVLDREATPIERLLNGEGEQLVVQVPHIEPVVYVAVWKVMVGRVPLYLMDTDIDRNDPWNRGISAHLYIGDLEQRLRQEIVLGIGGCAVLEALGIRHSVMHLNEGHSAFAIFERIRERIQRGIGFSEAVRQVKTTTIFTTHTPVPAGHDVFPFYLMDKYFAQYYPLLGLNREAFMECGIHPDEPASGFNMTAFALKMSAYRNGVSRKHGEVARTMWKSIWPDLKEADVPIDAITNGIHVPTWIEPKLELLFNKYLGRDWLEKHDEEEVWKSVDAVPDRELWEVYIWLKNKLINYIREQTRRQWVTGGMNPVNVVTGGTLLDPTALTIGFARRFASYKRADLILQDPERLKRILNNRWRPVQIIFAGKAHPADDVGKRIIQQLFLFALDPSVGGRIAFVENYDEQLAQYMVHGVDIWLNNPLPPMEACGTSGMKATLNGVPQLSILDGWWPEGFNGKNGWAFEGKSDKADAESIYSLLEDTVVPMYYSRDERGIPHVWIRTMKDTIKQTGAIFSARRMLKEYALRYYQKALISAGV